jgi:putative transcriptional regulator
MLWRFRREKSRDLSQQKMADYMSVSRQTYNEWENNKHLPSLPDAMKLAKFFGCTVDDLFVEKV